MNIKFISEGDWLTEKCFRCDSINHIFVENKNADAWQCWNCFNKEWLSLLTVDTYCIVHKIGLKEAHNRLENEHHTIYYLNGQSYVE